ncbi:MAG: hypothetical protein A3F68_08890 [Acidobacteria bacterium RIFCSPLOWO2_12_FULL_54_10]|nr:MAG: hypothetical protein A3F68_08890 [Acidobacteria bacterium RIFCSPLOWO2_12_FULL_54_10]
MNSKRKLAVLGLSILSMSLFVFVPKIWGWESGRMTGGGSIFTGEDDHYVPAGTRITHGFELHCGPALDEPNNLQIDIHPPDGGTARFHLEQLDSSSSLCYSDFDPRPPQAPISSFEGSGRGRYNGQPGYCATWRFTDKGEPGTEDEIYSLLIWNCDGDGSGVVQVVSPGHTLTFGNHQAHSAAGRP